MSYPELDPRDARPAPPMDSAGVYHVSALYPPAPRPPSRRRPRRRTAAILAAVLAAVGIAAAGLVAAVYLERNGVTVPGLPAALASAEPKTAEAAKAAAQRAIDRAAAGDAGGAWDLMSAHTKSLISRQDYMRYAKECPGATGLGAEVTDARLETPEKAVVIIKAFTFTVSSTMIYEGRAWAWEPTPEQTVDWAKPVEQRVAEGKADGSCASSSSAQKVKVGDCLAGDEITGTSVKDVDLNIVTCTDVKAKYKVIGIKDGVSRAESLKDDTTVCNDYIGKGAESVLWQGIDVAKGQALCLGPAK